MPENVNEERKEKKKKEKGIGGKQAAAVWMAGWLASLLWAGGRGKLNCVGVILADPTPSCFSVVVVQSWE